MRHSGFRAASNRMRFPTLALGPSMENPSTTVAMTFSGGLGLAAYHAGVYEAHAQQNVPLHWVSGSSAGAVTAALIAGAAANPPA